MSLDSVTDWFNLLFVAPLGFALHKMMNHSTRITSIETWKDSTEKRLEKLDKIDDICNDVSYIKGFLDERFKKD